MLFRSRRSVDAFLEFVEQAPDAARVLLTVPAGNPVAAVEKARQMAGAKERLVEARGQQRQALARSALVDGRRFAHAFGRILAGMA